MKSNPLERAALERDHARFGPVASFAWHTQQQYALRAATDNIVIVGGNRSGKSKAGEGIVSRVQRREGPIYQRLQKPKGRPLTIWVAPQTDEKVKSLWEPRLRDMFVGTKHRYIQTPHPVFHWEDKDGGGSLWLKSQEQGFMAFESNEVDLVLFDEEPEDKRVATSAKLRLSTTNGVLVYAFTPLNGMTWTYDDLYAPVAEIPQYRIADRVWRRGTDVTVVQMGMADNPAAVQGGGVERIRKDPSMTVAEKNARLYGQYGFTEGLLFPQFAALTASSDLPHLIDRLPEGRPYQWTLLADPNKRHAALLCAIDPDENWYVAAEHYAESLPDSEHARGYDGMLAQYKLKPDDVAVFADPGGAGGQAIINLGEIGYYATAVPKDPGSVSASIKRVRRAAWVDPRHPHPTRVDENGDPKIGAPHLYFVRTISSRWKSGGTAYEESRLFWELRQYRQKANTAPDTPVKSNDDATDCLRYLALAHENGPIRSEDDDPKRKAREHLDQLSRKEAQSFDDTMTRLEEQFAATKARYRNR